MPPPRPEVKDDIPQPHKLIESSTAHVETPRRPAQRPSRAGSVLFNDNPVFRGANPRPLVMSAKQRSIARRPAPSRATPTPTTATHAPTA
mgnify:CR=1 FL=1